MLYLFHCKALIFNTVYVSALTLLSSFLLSPSLPFHNFAFLPFSYSFPPSCLPSAMAVMFSHSTVSVSITVVRSFKPLLTHPLSHYHTTRSSSLIGYNYYSLVTLCFFFFFLQRCFLASSHECLDINVTSTSAVSSS